MVGFCRLIEVLTRTLKYVVQKPAMASVVGGGCRDRRANQAPAKRHGVKVAGNCDLYLNYAHAHWMNDGENPPCVPNSLRGEREAHYALDSSRTSDKCSREMSLSGTTPTF